MSQFLSSAVLHKHGKAVISLDLSSLFFLLLFSPSQELALKSLHVSTVQFLFVVVSAKGNTKHFREKESFLSSINTHFKATHMAVF